MNKLKDTFLYAFESSIVDHPIYKQNETKNIVYHLLMIGRKKATPLTNKKMKIQFKNLKNTGELKFLYAKEGAKEYTLLLDNKVLLSRLSDYLRNKDEYDIKYSKLGHSIDEKMNCSAFCFFIRGWGKEQDMITMWDNGIYEVGDVITIYNKDNEKIEGSIHTSIYVGEGLFLSKFGPEGDLVLTSLENMQNYYDTDVVIKEMPRHEYEARFGKKKEA